MEQYIDNIDNLVEKLLEVIPISYFTSSSFEDEIQKSQYNVQWNFLQSVNFSVKQAFVGKEVVAELTLKKMCKTLIQDGAPFVYKFVFFLIKRYCEGNQLKINLKKIRIALRSIGVLSFTEIDKYAIDVPFTNNLIFGIRKWDEIKDAINELENDCRDAETTIAYQNIGNFCRDLIISVAQIVFNPDIHKKTNNVGKEISKTDAIGMLSNYFAYNLSGSSNELYRKYAKAANDLANMLTHKRSATKKDMLITVSATLSLINLIGVIEEKFD